MNRSDEIKFIKKSLTPTNEKDVYYINIEDMTKKYYAISLIGLVMILIFLLS